MAAFSGAALPAPAEELFAMRDEDEDADEEDEAA
jgi:hypothetical protein